MHLSFFNNNNKFFLLFCVLKCYFNNYRDKWKHLSFVVIEMFWSETGFFNFFMLFNRKIVRCSIVEKNSSSLARNYSLIWQGWVEVSRKSKSKKFLINFAKSCHYLLDACQISFSVCVAFSITLSSLSPCSMMFPFCANKFSSQ